MSPRARAPSPLFARGTWPETRRIADILRRETVGGALLLAATVVAMIWANSAWVGGYTDLRELTVGPSALHLDLTLGEWAADGLLAIFFFVAGLELKREFVAGDLRDPGRAALPITAAIGGMVVPAAVHCRGGPSRSPPISPSPWLCWRLSAGTCQPRCAPSC